MSAVSKSVPNSDVRVSYPTIVAALAAASAGDTVFVEPGTYAESFTIPAGVILEGTGGERVTKITGALATGTRVTLGGASAKIVGFEVTLPTDALPAVTYAGAAQATAREIRLVGAGASGKGITNTGSGILMLLNVSYVSGTCDAVLESTAGTLVCVGSAIPAGTSAAGYRATGGVMHLVNIAITSATCTDALSVGNAEMKVADAVIEGATTGARVTHANSQFVASGFRCSSSVTNHLIVNGGISPTRVLVTSGEMDRNKVSYDAGIRVTIMVMDTTTGDEGMIVRGEVAIGRPGEGSELIVGEGDSYTSGMVVKTNTNLEAGTWATITAAMASSSGSTSAAFPGVAAANAIYYGSDYKFSGLKVKATAAIALGAGALIHEFWNGSSWVAFNLMAADSVGANPSAYAQDIFGRIAFEQVRWDDSAFTAWATKTIDGSLKYWVRTRISVGITTSPTLEQIKIHSNRTEINGNGSVEHYGTGQPLRSLNWSQKRFDGLTGSVAGNAAVPVTTNVGFDFNGNQFANTAVDGLAGIVQIPEGLDTSRPIRLVWNWIALAGSGDVEFESNSGAVKLGDTLDGTLSDTPQAKIVTALAVDVLKQDFFDFDVSALVPGEFLAFSLFRDGGVGNGDDTLTGNVALITVDVLGTYWR